MIKLPSPQLKPQPTIQNHQAAARAQEQLEGRRVTLGQAVEQGVAAVSACGWMGGVGGWGGVGGCVGCVEGAALEVVVLQLVERQQKSFNASTVSWQVQAGRVEIDHGCVMTHHISTPSSPSY